MNDRKIFFHKSYHRMLHRRPSTSSVLQSALRSTPRQAQQPNQPPVPPSRTREVLLPYGNPVVRRLAPVKPPYPRTNTNLLKSPTAMPISGKCALVPFEAFAIPSQPITGPLPFSIRAPIGLRLWQQRQPSGSGPIRHAAVRDRCDPAPHDQFRRCLTTWHRHPKTKRMLEIRHYWY